MHPRSPRARRALSVLIVVHVVCVTLWVVPEQVNPLRPLAAPWVRTLQMSQAWTMFANKSATERYMLTEGLDRDGELVWALPDNRPDGPRWWSSPRADVRRAVRGKRMEPWLAWACEQAPPEVRSVRLVRLETTLPPPERWAETMETTDVRRVLKRRPCP